MWNVYPITQERKVLRYRSSILLTSWLQRAISVVTYSCPSSQKELSLRVVLAFWVDVEAAIRFVGCRPGLVGRMNAMPVVFR